MTRRREPVPLPTVRPRLGPGAPPLPPAKRPDEPWAAFTVRLAAYTEAVSAWQPTHGWTVADRAALVCEGEEALADARGRKDETP